jgi:hypothetical protein
LKENTISNKIYNISNKEVIGDYKIENNKIFIHFNNNILEYNIFFEENQKIKLFKNLYKNITLFKNYKEVATININGNCIKCNNKTGIYKILDNKLELEWLSNNEIEVYILYNEIYILLDYYSLNNEDIYLFINNDYKKFKINLLECYLYDESYSYIIKFVYDNNIFYLFNKELFSGDINKYCLKKNDVLENILSTTDKFIVNILIKENIDININIYKLFNNKDDNILEIYKKLLLDSNKIYSVETFLNRYRYFGYNNENNENNIINWYNNNLTNKDIFSKLNNIEYCFISDSFNSKDKNLYIINLDDNNYLENIIDNISKISNIILIYNINNLNNLEVFNYILFLKKYFKHIIIVKINNVYVDVYHNIYNNYLIKEVFNSIDKTFFYGIQKVIYVKNNIENFDTVILNINNYDEDKIYLINKQIYYNNISIIDDILDDYLINFCIYDIVIIIIFNYLLKSKLLNNSLICNINTIRYILE